MIHEPRCIHIPCTCIEILREKLEFLGSSNYSKLDKLCSLSNEIIALNFKIKSLENKIKDGLSCCCSGCTKHNQDLSAPMDK